MKMKKSIKIINLLLIVTMSIGILSSCSKGDNKPIKTPLVSEIEEAILKKINIDETVKLDDKKLERVYGIEASELDGYFVYVSTSNVSADEVAVFKVKDSSKVNAIKSKIEERMVSLSNTYRDYAPAEAKKIDNKVIVDKGNYILVVVSDNSETVVNTYNKCFE